LLRAPEADELQAVLAAGGGAVRIVTLAPELPGAVHAVRAAVAAGAVVAVGHTDASYEVTRNAIAEGARLGTHLFNAMRPLRQREPGPVAALLEDPRVTVELIADGVHIHPAVLRMVISQVGPSRVALVTDAMAAAGTSDGTFRLGSMEVDVRDGVARLSGQDVIAGSTLTMDAAFRFAVVACDVSLADAATMTSCTPARVLGRADVGDIEVGRRADLVVLDDDLAVKAVMVAGRWVPDVLS
jgi:N-acetylglucosamine-6-phosphate deacetylase